MKEEKRIPLPEAFLERMERLLGDEYPAFIESYEKEKKSGLRFNSLKWRAGDREDAGADRQSEEEFVKKIQAKFGLRKILWTEEGYYYEADKRPGKHPLHEAGAYYIQEPSAMAVVCLLDPKPGERVLDLCAAPGGKTTQIAARMRQKGILISNEIHPARAKILSQNVERMGIGNAVVTNQDSQTLLNYFPEFFDKILVDAPCSGEGMFRKDQQARQEWSIEHVTLCASRQARILDDAAGMLKPGGRLVYSTCTFSPEENEGSIQDFLDRNKDFVLEDAEIPTGFSSFGHGQPGWIQDGREELSRTFRIWPHKTQGEGHFLALLKKEIQGPDIRETDNRKKTRKVSETGGRKDNKTLEAWAVWQQFAEAELSFDACGDREERESFVWETGRLVMYGGQMYVISWEMPDIKGLKVLRPGLHLGEVKKNRFQPSHSLAMYLRKEQVKQWISLEGDGELIQRYISGQTIDVSCLEGIHRSHLENGWVLITVDGISAGWAKLAGNTLKNHYPKGLRK